MPSSRLKGSLSDLITAAHVLHQQGVLDEYGHISIRHPEEPSTFLQSSTPALLLDSPSQIHQYNVSSGERTDCEKTSPYSEHFIHASLYGTYEGINAVVHSHSHAVSPFTVSQTPLRPISHTAGFLGSAVPIFDLAANAIYTIPNLDQNLLINSRKIADLFVDSFYADPVNSNPTGRKPDHTVVLQRGHGFSTWAENLPDVVYRAVFTHRNAQAQAAAQALGGRVTFLSEQETKTCAAQINSGMPKLWPSLKAQVERSQLYHNELAGY